MLTAKVQWRDIWPKIKNVCLYSKKPKSCFHLEDDYVINLKFKILKIVALYKKGQF